MLFKRFYDDTVRPLVAYDEQYETDLLGTLATFLECDANVNATAARLITHRHTIRYRFERVRELTGLDVSSTDGRGKRSLSCKKRFHWWKGSGKSGRSSSPSTSWRLRSMEQQTTPKH